MTCNLYYSSLGYSNPSCQYNNITNSLNSMPGARYPKGDTTLEGVSKMLDELQIPYEFSSGFGTFDLSSIDDALKKGKFVVVSEGQVKSFIPIDAWGHVLVILGDDGVNYTVLDPALGTGPTELNKHKFYTLWWVHPFVSPMWIIGE
jgi:hypothetical protein